MNEKFVKLVEGFFTTKHAIYTAKTSLQLALVEPSKIGEDVNTEKQGVIISCFEKV